MAGGRRTNGGMKPGRKLALIILGVILIAAFGKGLVRITRLLFIKHDRVEQRDEALRQKNYLETEIERLTSDSLYIEELARREYGMIKEGEEAYRLTLPDSSGEGK